MPYIGREQCILDSLRLAALQIKPASYDVTEIIRLGLNSLIRMALGNCQQRVSSWGEGLTQACCHRTARNRTDDGDWSQFWLIHCKLDQGFSGKLIIRSTASFYPRNESINIWWHWFTSVMSCYRSGFRRTKSNYFLEKFAFQSSLCTGDRVRKQLLMDRRATVIFRTWHSFLFRISGGRFSSF